MMDLKRDHASLESTDLPFVAVIVCVRVCSCVCLCGYAILFFDSFSTCDVKEGAAAVVGMNVVLAGRG